MSCKAGRLYAQGPVLAVSGEQRDQITETIEKDNKLLCSGEQERQVHGGTGLTYTR